MIGWEKKNSQQTFTRGKLMLALETKQLVNGTHLREFITITPAIYYDKCYLSRCEHGLMLKLLVVRND